MRIATFNINNVNKRLANLLEWLAVAQPDVVCLQELKAADKAFPLAAKAFDALNRVSMIADSDARRPGIPI